MRAKTSYLIVIAMIAIIFTLLTLEMRRHQLPPDVVSTLPIATSDRDVEASVELSDSSAVESQLQNQNRDHTQNITKNLEQVGAKIKPALRPEVKKMSQSIMIGSHIVPTDQSGK